MLINSNRNGVLGSIHDDHVRMLETVKKKYPGPKIYQQSTILVHLALDDLKAISPAHGIVILEKLVDFS